MLRYVSVAAVLFYFSVATGHQLPFHGTKCLPALGKYPFDEQKFSGDWFAVANVFTPKRLMGEMKCHKIHYSSVMVGNVTRTNFRINIKMADGTEKALEAKGQGLKPGMASSTIMSYKFSTDEKWHNIMKHSILATDYETYALIHGCKEFYDDKTDMFSKFVIDQIWSRSQTLDEGTFKILKSVMSSLNIDDSDWELIDNSAC